MNSELFSPEPVSEGMLYGPPRPPEFYPPRDGVKLDIDLYPYRETAELVMEDARDDIDYYNLLMLRAQLTMDRARNVVSDEVFIQNYSRLSEAIVDLAFQQMMEAISNTTPPMPVGRKRK